MWKSLSYLVHKMLITLSTKASLFKNQGFEQIREKLSTGSFLYDKTYVINISTSTEDEE